MNPRGVLGLAVLVGMPWAGIAAPSDDTRRGDHKSETIEHIVVTATRTDRDPAEVARSISIVDRATIESIQGQSVADLLAYLPNVTAAGGPRAGSQTVNIRGLGGNKLLQTVDGARISFESGHRPSYYLDPELLKAVEALRGPASSLWGSGALGGVIAQRTLDPSDLVGDESFGGFVRSGFNKNSSQSTTTIAVAGEGESLDWMLSGYYRDSDDLELGNGETLTGSASRDQGMLGKLQWQLGDNHDIQLNVRASENEGTVPTNGTATINPRSNFLIDRKTETVNSTLTWDYANGGDWLDSRVLVYWNQIDISEARASDLPSDDTLLDEYGVNLMNVSQLGSVSLQYGADIYREEFSADRSGANRPTPPKAKSDIWSLYVQASVPLSDQWRVDLGMRHDDFETQADNLGIDRSDGDTTTSLALVWTPTDWANLAVRYDEAFRAPTAEELYTSGTHFCLGTGFCNRFQPNPELDPEQAANVEFIGELTFTDVLGTDNAGLQLSVFRNEVDDFIEQIVSGPSFFPFPDAGTTNWVNVSEATIDGFELQASYQRDAFDLRLAYGQTRGEDDLSGEDLTNIPADTLTADVSYRFLADTLITGLRVTHADSQRRTQYGANIAGVTYDGYTVTDFYASWAPRQVPGVRLDLNINNLSDEFYNRAWDQLPEAGREVILTARYSF